jgi:Leucine-rich repeat (LRR) protein
MKTTIFYSILVFLFFNAFEPQGFAQCNTSRAEDSITLSKLYASTNGSAWKTKWNLSSPINTWAGVMLNSGGRVSTLNLSNNNLTGTLPPELANLCNLEVLNLSINAITGTFPPEMRQLNSLSNVNLRANAFTGQIPSFVSYPLTDFNLSDNQFTGAFPALDSCRSLLNVNLSFNKINDTIPVLFCTMHADLRYFYAQSNQLTGSIPSEISNLNNLWVLNLSSNKLTGRIPNEITKIICVSTLRELYLQNNQLTGIIPQFLGDLKELTTIDLSSNQLTGPIPPRLDSLPLLDSLQLNSNRLTGPIPATLGSLPKLRFFSVANNQLSDTIPASFGNDTALVSLSFGNNGTLKGTIPTTLGNLKNLELFDASSNQLTGILPASLSNATKLRILLLNNNKLSDTIPRQYALLDSLNYFQVSTNQLTATVPFNISKIKKLAFIDISNNRFDSLPNFSGGFLRYLESVNNKGFYFSKNKFTFDDIIPNMPLNTKANFGYQYLGQDSFLCVSSTIPISRGNTYTFNASNIDAGLTTNVYKWYKDNKLINVTNTNSLTFKNIQPCQAGVYSCQITNPLVPGMTLYCTDQTFAVSEPFHTCAPYEVKAFPNPVQNVLNLAIVSPPDDVRLLKLSNMLGQEVVAKRFDEGDLLNGLTLDCAHFPNGSYILSLYTEGGTLSLTKRIQVLKK